MQKLIEPLMIIFYIVITGFYIIMLVKDGVTSIRLYQYLVTAVLVSAIVFRVRMYFRK